MNPNLIPSQILHKRVSLVKALLGPSWTVSALPKSHLDAAEAEFDRVKTWHEAEQIYSGLAAWLIPGIQWLCRRRTVDMHPPDAECSISTDPRGSIGCASRIMPLLRYGLKVKPAGVETVCAITAYDLLQCIVPTLAWIYCLHDQLMVSLPREKKPARCLVALAGIPGAGKSVLACLLETFSGLLDSWPAIQAIGIDGWHFMNQVLENKEIIDETGQKVPLMTRKGSPESYDVKSLARAIARLAADPSPLRLPVYDRSRHEPVADAIEITAPIVLVEGNYVLMRRQGWDDVCDKHHFGIWLDASFRLTRCRMIKRDVAIGRSSQQAQAKWEQNDWPNSLAAMGGRDNADAVVYVDSHRRLNFSHRLRSLNLMID